MRSDTADIAPLRVPIGALLAGAILLDLGMQGNLVLGQRAIYALGAATRSRLNGLCDRTSRQIGRIV